MRYQSMMAAAVGCLLAGTAANAPAADAKADAGGMKMIPAVQATTTTVSRPVISARGAQSLLQAAQAMAERNHWGMSVTIVDDAGNLVAFLRMDGAPMGTIDVSRGKAVTAIKFKMPTSMVQQMVSGGGGMLTIPGITALTGGYPVMVNGQVVGAIGVSGGLGDEDDRTAQAALAAFKG